MDLTWATGGDPVAAFVLTWGLIALGVTALGWVLAEVFAWAIGQR